MEVTNNNFIEAMTGILYAFKVSDYDSECFSANEVVFHNVCEKNCIKVVEEIEKAGYNPYSLLKNILQKLNITNLKDNFPTNLKNVIDENFSVEVEEYYVKWGNNMAKQHHIS